jgi:predicted nucleic acid-binding Zn ribbon protein
MQYPRKRLQHQLFLWVSILILLIVLYYGEVVLK